jgi:hypothetical protein
MNSNHDNEPSSTPHGYDDEAGFGPKKEYYEPSPGSPAARKMRSKDESYISQQICSMWALCGNCEGVEGECPFAHEEEEAADRQYRGISICQILVNDHSHFTQQKSSR